MPQHNQPKPLAGSLRRSARLKDRAVRPDGDSVPFVQSQLDISSIQARRTTNDSESPLLRLPPEIWTIIGRFAVVESGEFQVDRNKKSNGFALLRVCWRLRHEFIAIFYADNAFTVKAGEYWGNGSDETALLDLQRFLEIVPIDMTPKIRNIHFYGACDRRFPEGMRSRAAKASKIEHKVFGQLRDPPVVWVALPDLSTQQCGFINRLCSGGMKKWDGTLMSGKERMIEWTASCLSAKPGVRV